MVDWNSFQYVLYILFIILYRIPAQIFRIKLQIRRIHMYDSKLNNSIVTQVHTNYNDTVHRLQFINSVINRNIQS